MGNNQVNSLESEYSLPTKANSNALAYGKASGFKHFLIMKMATWSRESHGLFDYENKNTTK